MNNPYKLPLTVEKMDELLRHVLINNEIENIRLTADEIMNVRRLLAKKYTSGKESWSPSWDALAAIALTLRRPGLLKEGREIEMFATGVAYVASIDTGDAWQYVLQAHVSNRRGLILAALEYLQHGVPDSAKTDMIRYDRLVRGVAAAREAGFPARIEALLAGPQIT